MGAMMTTGRLSPMTGLEPGRRPKRCQLGRHPRLRRMVARKLRRNWSPEQIAGC